MPKLIAITLGAVAAVLASVWFRRRPALKKPRAIDPRIDEQPHSAKAQVTHGADAGLSAQRMILERQDQSSEAPQDLTREPSTPDLRDVSILSTLQTEEVASGATGEMVAGALPVLEYPSEKSEVATPAEPIGIHPSADPVPPPSTNGFLPDRVDEEIREPKEKYARIAAPRIASPQNEEIVGEPGTPVDLPKFSETAIRIASSELAGVAEEMKAPDTAVEEPAQPRMPLRRSAASSPHRAPSSDRKAAAASVDGAKSSSPSSESLRKPRTFSEPVPSPTQKNGTKSERKSDPTPRTDSNLPIRLQLVFGSGGSVKKLVLIPHRGEGMAGIFEVATVAGDRFELSEASSDSYESLAVSAFDNPLSDGVVFQARSDTQMWRWELTRREIYVLAAGDAFGLSGFVTRHRDQRLWLNIKHAVLAKEGLRDQVMGALNEAGCGAPEVCDSTTPGVPAGWILIPNVTPTRAVPMREEQNILNVLCPGHEIEPQFTGGIRLERSVWLVGFPPRIRFAGELENGFRVLIDDQSATLANDGAFESPGWDREGEHRLWFSDRAQTYALRTMEEGWDSWPAHRCGAGAAICGAGTYRIDDARWRQFCIPAANLVLIGARPGEIFRCRISNGAHSDWVLTTVPFTPVWALPSGRLSKKNPAAAIELVEFKEPLNEIEESSPKLKVTSALRKWIFAVRNARRNRVKLAARGDETDALWRRYGDVAKRLRKQLR
jgi:hypothetical protein